MINKNPRALAYELLEGCDCADDELGSCCNPRFEDLQALFWKSLNQRQPWQAFQAVGIHRYPAVTGTGKTRKVQRLPKIESYQNDVHWSRNSFPRYSVAAERVKPLAVEGRAVRNQPGVPS